MTLKHRSSGLAVGLLALSAVLLAPGGTAPVRATGGTYAPQMQGRVVRVTRLGAAPNGDPRAALVLVATLHDPRPAAQALPDATLVLKGDLEEFSPRTAPTLPDLLRPAQPAAALVGFLQGQATLINAAGHVADRGAVLAEFGAGHSLRLVLSLASSTSGASGGLAHLSGLLALHRGGTATGELVAEPGARFAALAGRRGRQPSWQAVAAGLPVAAPPMLGRPLAAAAAAPPSAPHTGGVTLATLWVGLAAALACAGLLLWLHPALAARSGGA